MCSIHFLMFLYLNIITYFSSGNKILIVIKSYVIKMTMKEIGKQEPNKCLCKPQKK